MAGCEKCWADAFRRSYGTSKSQTECYYELLEERKDNPCTPEQQKYGYQKHPEKTKTINAVSPEGEIISNNVFEPAEQSELKIADCEVFLLNNECLNPFGDFKAKIVVICPSKIKMDEVEEYLKKGDRLEAAEKEIERLKGGNKC